MQQLFTAPHSVDSESPAPALLAEVVRSGMVESRHYGAVVALNADGVVAWSVGPVTVPIYPRSANKPLQTLGMLRHGLGQVGGNDLPPQLIALACGSHSAEPFHLAGVREILAKVGLAESDLLCPPELPLAPGVGVPNAVDRVVTPSRIAMNCSGKHAAMLATCVANNWSLTDYLSAEHPLQVGIKATFAAMTGEPVSHIGVDGCGAPVFATSLVGLARGYSRLVRGLGHHGQPDAAARQVAQAMVAHPEYVSGTGRDERRSLTALPGAIAKMGAEGVYALGLPDGRAIALKIADGTDRARPPVMVAALRAWGVLDEAWVDAAQAAEAGRRAVFGGGAEVGEVRAVPLKTSG